MTSKPKIFLDSYNNKKIKIINYNNELWYNGKDLLYLLKYKKKYYNIILYKISKKYKGTINTILKIKAEINYENNEEIYINKEGLKYIIFKTIKVTPKIYNKIKKFNFIKNLEVKNKIILSYNEDICIKEILFFFSFVKTIKYFKIDNYIIDIYFPEYNLAIECDELNNQKCNLDRLIKREKYISDKLKCTFIYINPNKKNFSLINTIKQINEFIYVEIFLKSLTSD